ncbi:DUF1772 domain-containing protein [bacterium]|nr:MAG: DUF1772 domain-containing protein [bacterium]
MKIGFKMVTLIDCIAARYILAGSVFYILGGLIVTIAVNVPMNDALATAHPGTPEATKLWASYLTNWTAWNHVRTVACLASTVSYALGLAL